MAAVAVALPSQRSKRRPIERARVSNFLKRHRMPTNWKISSNFFDNLESFFSPALWNACTLLEGMKYIYWKMHLSLRKLLRFLNLFMRDKFYYIFVFLHLIALLVCFFVKYFSYFYQRFFYNIISPYQACH